MSTTGDASTDELTRELADGWTIHVRGGWHDDQGFSGGHTSGGRHFSSLPGDTVEELRAAILQQRAEDEREAATSQELHVRLVRAGVDVTVIDERRLPADDPATLLWPPIVVPDGVVLRWERTTTSIDRPDGRPVEPGEAPHNSTTTIQRPWFVSAEGELSQLPFELSTAPIAVWPDGRLLMPSIDPLWWDGDDEPLTLLDLTGGSESLVVDGTSVTPSRVLTAIGEDASNGNAERADAPHWRFREAMIEDDRLRLRLTNDDAEPEEWIAVEIGLAQRWAVRRIGAGEVAAGESLPPL